MNATRLVHLRRLRQQPLRTAVAVVAVAAGVALLAGVTIARTSIATSIDGYTSGLSGEATLRVEGPVDHGGIQESVLPRLAAVDGVAAAVPLVVARAIGVDGAGGEQYVASLGVDCAIEAVIGAFGCDSGSLDSAPVALSPRLLTDLGPDGVLRTDGGPVDVSDAVAVDSLDAFNGGAVAIYSLAEAQERFSRPGRLDLVLIVPKADANATELRSGVIAAAGPSNQVVDASDPFEDSSAVEQLLLGLLLTSLMGLIVGGQLVHNTLLLSFEERREELALLGAVGGTPRQIARGVLAEASLLGAVGGLLGAGFGMAIAGTFVSSLSDQAERTAGIHLDVHIALRDVVIAAIFGIAAACLGAAVPARRAARLDLAGELAGRRREDVVTTGSKVLTGLLLLGTAGGLVAAWAGSRDGSLEQWQPWAAVGGMGLGVSCAFRLPGRVAPALVDACQRGVRQRTGLVRVAQWNLAGDPGRTRAVTTALAAAVSIAVTLGTLVPSIEAGGRAEAATTAEGLVTVSAVPLNNGSGVDAKLTAAEEAALDRIDGVAARFGSYHALVSHPLIGALSMTATDGPPPSYRTLRGSDAATAVAAGHVMIGPALARDLDLDPGDAFTFPGLAGLSELIVGGIWASPDGLGRNVTLEHAGFEQLLGPRPPTTVRLLPEAGISPSELARRVRAAGFGPHVIALTPDELADVLASEFRAFAEPFRALQYGLLGVAFAATASTLLLVAVQRRRENALLLAVGLTPRGLSALAGVEVAILAVVAIFTGAIAGLVGAVAFAWASAVLTGLAFPAPVTLSPLPVVAAAVLIVAGAAAALPALRSSRINPAIALREE